MDVLRSVDNLADEIVFCSCGNTSSLEVRDLPDGNQEVKCQDCGATWINLVNETSVE